MTNQVAIVVGMVAGLAMGLLASVTGSPLLLRLSEGVAPLGTAFISLIRMVVIPLVVFTIFTGVATLADPRRLGRMGGVTLAFFWTTSIVGIVIGMGVMKLGLLAGPPSIQTFPAEEVRRELPSAVDFLLGLIPSNPFAAAANGDLLALIVFTVMFGAAAASLPEAYKKTLMEIADSVTIVLITLVHWALWTAPVGVFALSAPVAAAAGLDVLKSLAVFIVSVTIALVIFNLVVYAPAVRFLARQRVGHFGRAAVGPQVIAMSTTSSPATLPAMMEVSMERLNVSRTVAGLVLSLGAGINRAGSALFQGAAVIFLAGLYDVTIPAAALGSAVLATFFVSLTVAGVPSASLVTLAPALETVGVPLAGIGLLFGVDRIPDMFRSATNVTGTMVAATVVEELERIGEAGRTGDTGPRHLTPDSDESPPNDPT